MIAPRKLLSTLLLALGLVACKTDEGTDYGNVPQADAAPTYATLYCDLLSACDCDFPIPADQCVDLVTSQFQGSFDEAAAAGLTYHGECLGAYLEYIESVGCKTVDDLLADPDLGEFDLYGCKTFSGTAAEGEACTNYYEINADSCQQGLACFDNVCVMLSTTEPETKQVGETCDPQTELCVDGAFCTNSVEAPMAFTCVALPSVGDSCMTTYLCDEASWCDTTDFLCKAPLGAGEACDPFSGGAICAAGLFCNEATSACDALGVEGEPCEYDDQCAEGLNCDEPPADDGSGDICQPRGPLVCGG